MERVLGIDCHGAALVGILAEPAAGSTADLGVIVIVGGPQYRAGSHRQFTLLARHLAAHGFPTLRFDYRGMGDSGGDARDFLGVQDDIAAAIQALQTTRPDVRRVVLWGLCDAASAALLYLDATHDSRIAGVALANPWVRSAESLAKAHVKHYYWRRLREKSFWLKLLRGGVGMRALGGLAHNLKLARPGAQAADARSFQERMAAGLRSFPGPTLLVLSGDDYTAREFAEYSRTSPAWQGLLQSPSLARQDMPGADHTFSSSSDLQALNELCLRWLQSRC